MQKIKNSAYCFLIILYISGTIGMIVKPSFYLPLTPFTLLYTSFVFLIFQPLSNKKYLFSFLLVALIGFISEIIGVKTGLIFGSYNYGNNLGIKVFEVPLIISLNWALILNCSLLIGSYITNHKLLLSLITAIIATGLDVLIEQSAPKMDFWYFNEGIAGLHNYVSWFTISFFVSFIFSSNLKLGNKKIALTIFILQLFLFGIIYFFNQ
ncbi:MAG: carotenoid biosynthesis protein [Burkholderiales bacterium]|nr:carotenoid biosynthesis protein [Bacteroidia bacterium]